MVASVLTVAQAQQVPTLTLTPSSGEVGDLIAVTGSGFEGTGSVTIFLTETGGTVLATTPIADRNGNLEPTGFTIPELKASGYTVVACRWVPETGECLGATAAAKLTVLDPPTTTTTLATTSTTSVTSTTLVEGLATTTSSLVLGVTTTIGGDPPPPNEPTGVAFTTTSTSLDLPSGLADQNVTHFPDIEITDVEVTQGIQDLQNRMPLVANKRTVVRVYVAADRDPGGELGDLAGTTPGESEEVIGPEGWEPVDGLLQLKRGGQDELVYPVNAPITAYRRGSDRLNGNETLNFEIPDGWATEEVEMTVLVWSFLPETIITSEPDAGNNFAQGSVFFHETDAPQVIWFRLDTSSGGLDPDDYDLALETATQSYITFHPVAVPNFLQIFATLGPGSMVGDDEPSEEFDYVDNRTEPLNRMRFLHAQWGLEELERMHGLIPGSTQSSDGGLTSWNSLVAWSKPTETTPAHEGAHMYFIQHAPCQDDDDDGQPDEVGGGGWGWIDQTYPAGLPSCSIAPEDPEGYYGVQIGQETQLDVFSNSQSLPNVRYPFMGYETPRWVDAYHYCLLMEYYDINCDPGSIGLDPKPKPGAPVDCGPPLNGGIVIDFCLWNGQAPIDQQGGQSGTMQLAISEEPKTGFLLVDVDVGDLSLGHAELLESSQYQESNFDFVVSRAKNGDMSNEHMLRVTDPTGQILVQIPISSSVGGHSATDGTVGGVELIPWYEDAASLDLLHNGEVVASKRPTAPPSVDIDPFEPGGSREFQFSWTGSDPDGDDLLYTAFWSVDNGETWRVLDTQLTGNSARVGEDLVLPGGDVLVKVVASDGFSSGMDIFGPVEVPEGVPTGIVVAPDTVPQYSSDRMTFQAQDPEDGAITSGTWSSDIDGALGDGQLMWVRGLSLGTHEISVEVSDSSGNATVLTTNLEVVPGGLSAPRTEGAEPDAEILIRLGPANLDQFDLGSTENPVTTAETNTNDQGGLPVAAAFAAGLLLFLGTGLVIRRWRSTQD